MSENRCRCPVCQLPEASREECFMMGLISGDDSQALHLTEAMCETHQHLFTILNKAYGVDLNA